jgi:hypothetical protein
MLTVKAIVLKHHQKSDGSFNVKIRVTHNRVSRYIDTVHFVVGKQLNKKNEIKDNSFATLARNACRKSKDDIAMALNQIDEGR